MVSIVNIGFPMDVISINIRMISPQQVVMKRKCTTVYFQTLYFHVKLTYYKFFYTLLFPSQHISQESYEDRSVLWVVLIESMWSEMKATILIRSTFSEKDREKKLWIPHRSLKKNIASNYTYFFIIWCHPSY